jgi:carbon monoxide dehydrogenase subunit G
VKEGVDIMKIEMSVMIDRPAEVVWKFISDISNSKWDPYTLEAKQISAGPIGVGTTFQLIRSRTPKVHDLRVIEYEPPKKTTIESTSGPVKGTKQQFSLEEIEGKTKLTRTMDLKFSGFYKLLGPFSTGMLKKEGEADLDNIKRMVEAQS